MTTAATIRTVSRPRGEIPPHFRRCVEQAKVKRDACEVAYREAVVDALRAGGSFSEVSKLTGLSTNTLQRWKREAGK